MKSQNKAFTLIELLVVIAIIGILAGVVIASLNSARAKARDARRLSDMRTIQTALDMYYADNGSYPSSAGCGATIPNNSFCNSVESLSNGRWIAGGALAPYLPQDPLDPNHTGVANWSAAELGTYFYHSAGAQYGCLAGEYYRLVATMENSSNGMIGVGCNGNNWITGGNYNFIKK